MWGWMGRIGLNGVVIMSHGFFKNTFGASKERHRVIGKIKVARLLKGHLNKTSEERQQRKSERV